MSESSENLSEKPFRPSDVKDTTGLTYRQLNDWEQRGVLPKVEERGSGWRGYNCNELFLIAVLAELRNFYGIPVERLRFLKERFMEDQFDYFEYVWFKQNYLGMPIWLFTDFSGILNFMSQFEVSNYVENMEQQEHRNTGFAMFDISRILARVKATAEQRPVQLNMHGRGFDIRHISRSDKTARNIDEMTLLKDIRDPSIKSFEVIMSDGSVKVIKVTKKKPIETAVEELLAESEYQEIIIRQQDGKIVDLRQTTTYKSKMHD